MRRLRQKSCRSRKRRAPGSSASSRSSSARASSRQRFTTRLDEVKDTVQLKGFRKGKVPVAHIKKLYGRSRDGRGAAAGRRGDEPQGHRGAQRARRAPAQHQPDRGQGRDRARAVGAERSRLHDVLRGAARHQRHRPRRAQARARGGRRHRGGDRQGRGEPGRALDPLRGGGGPGGRRRRPAHHRFRRPHRREEFEGGKGEDVQLVVGESQFIPGFVEGLEGAKAGEERAVNAKFPDDYPREEAGRQGRGLRRQGQGGGQGRSSPSSTTSSPRRWAPRSLAKLRELVSGQDRQRVRRRSRA